MTTKQQWLESIEAALHWKSLHEYGSMGGRTKTDGDLGDQEPT